MEFETEEYNEEVFLAEFDKAIAEGRVRRGRAGEGIKIREAARQALAQLKAEERKATKKQSALVNA